MQNLQRHFRNRPPLQSVCRCSSVFPTTRNAWVGLVCIDLPVSNASTGARSPLPIECERWELRDWEKRVVEMNRADLILLIVQNRAALLSPRPQVKHFVSLQSKMALHNRITLTFFILEAMRFGGMPPRPCKWCGSWSFALAKQPHSLANRSSLPIGVICILLFGLIGYLKSHHIISFVQIVCLRLR